MLQLEGLLKKRGTTTSLSVDSPSSVGQSPTATCQQSAAELRELLVGFDLMSHKAKSIAQQLTLGEYYLYCMR